MHVLSTHPDPNDLVAHIDGEADPEVAAHVRHCADCTREIEALSHTASQLFSKLYRFDCPDSMSLGEYVLDLLDPDRRRLVDAHIVECEDCASEMYTLREYLAQNPGE